MSEITKSGSATNRSRSKGKPKVRSHGVKATPAIASTAAASSAAQAADRVDLEERDAQCPHGRTDKDDGDQFYVKLFSGNTSVKVTGWNRECETTMYLE